MTKRNLGALAALALAGLLGFWLVTIPRPLTQLAAHTTDVARGQLLYNAGGCHSCHSPAEGQTTIAAELPAGGKPFKTPIGVLYPPNLTPDAETGLGPWTDLDFVNAMQKGIGRDGGHLIPAFPFTSYAKMSVGDVLDIKAYLATLPVVKNQTPAHEVLALPIIRRGLGLWKYIGLDETPWANDATQSVTWNRGAYIVNGPGHCAECHTPRTLFMTSDKSRMFGGGPHPDGEGRVPSLVDLVGRKRYTDVNDLKTALQFGETFGYQGLAAGGMASVQRNIAKVPESDIAAIAEYIASLK